MRHKPPFMQPDFNHVEGVVSLDGYKYDAMLIPVWSISSPNKKGVRRVVSTFGRSGLPNPNAMVGLYVRSTDGGWGSPITRYLILNDVVYMIRFNGRSRNGKFIFEAVSKLADMKLSSLEFVFTKFMSKVVNAGD